MSQASGTYGPKSKSFVFNQFAERSEKRQIDRDEIRQESPPTKRSDVNDVNIVQPSGKKQEAGTHFS